MEYQLASLYECLTDAGPDALCLVAGDVRHTRRSLDETANRFAHHLLSAGVEPGDFVGIYSTNRAEWIEAFIGCVKISAVPINLNYRYVAAELSYVVDNAAMAAMVIEPQFMPVLAEVMSGREPMRSVLVLSGEDDVAQCTLVDGALLYNEALAEQPTDRDFGTPRSADDLYVLYTGGTTGMPKGVKWRHENAFFACFGGGNFYEPITTPEAIADNGVDPALPMTNVATGPLMHGGGQWLSMICIYSGGKAIVYTEPSFDPQKVLELAVAEDAVGIAVIGDAMGRPLAEAKLADSSLEMPNLMSIGNGGAMLTPAVKEQLHEAFPKAIITDAYGASETGAAGLGIDDSGGEGGSRFMVNEFTQVLDDDLRPIAHGSEERGILCRTGHIPLGYHGDEEKTAQVFRTDDNGKRWVVTGDWASVEADGSLVLYGRGSMSINTGGEKVYPEEVEAACRAHPDVYDAIAVGVPDDRFGERVVAIIEPRAGVTAPSLDELQTHLRGHIAGYKLPRDLIVDTVPHTPVGKPDYAGAKASARAALGIDA